MKRETPQSLHRNRSCNSLNEQNKVAAIQVKLDGNSNAALHKE